MKACALAKSILNEIDLSFVRLIMQNTHFYGSQKLFTNRVYFMALERYLFWPIKIICTTINGSSSLIKFKKYYGN